MMSPLVKTVFAAALMSIAVAGHAKADDKCIRMLEGRPDARDVAPVRPCPMAARFDARPGGPAESTAIGSSARTSLQPIPLADAAGGARSSNPAERARPA